MSLVETKGVLIFDQLLAALACLGFQGRLGRFKRRFQPTGVTAVVTRAHTGRRSGSEWEHALAKDWAFCPGPLGLRLHLGSALFQRTLHQANVVDEEVLTCYRGRPDDGSIQSWEQMGPPPRGVPPEGRYNATGTPVFYASSSLAGACRESSNDAHERLFVQAYTIPTRQLSIADFKPVGDPAFTDSVFDLAESARVEGRTGLGSYAFSRLVAAQVRRAGFDGMRAPGVRGDSRQQYLNIVMFKHASWHSWSLGDAGLQALDTSTCGD